MYTSFPQLLSNKSREDLKSVLCKNFGNAPKEQTLSYPAHTAVGHSTLGVPWHAGAAPAQAIPCSGQRVHGKTLWFWNHSPPGLK